MSADEELQTMEEKEAWLRARGVEIESPAERKAAAEAAAARQAAHPLEHVEGITRRVKYVLIPADESQPFEQLEAILAHDAHGDILPDVLAPKFAGGGSIDRRAAREQAVRQLGEKGLELSQDALDNATKQGATETFALVRPSSTNAHRGVYLYLDEVGLLKGLPPNPRANALARSCGFDGVSFYGDMYAGSIQAEPSPMVNVDFTVAELDSDAAWLKSAGAENYQYNQSMQQLQDAMREKGGMAGGFGAGGGDGGMPGGEGDGYAWSQTDDEVEIVIEVPEGTKAKDVKVAFKSESVEVVVGGAATAKAERLYRRVRPDECTWTIEGGKKVVVTLAKVDEQVWHAMEAIE
jgi:HSP20 family molecular chaperone IbpA